MGGGFVRDEDEIGRNAPDDAGPAMPFPFVSGADLLARADAAGLSIAELMFANETATRPAQAVAEGLEAIHAAMEACIDRGMRQEGRLPGGLEVKRRARQLHASIMAKMERQIVDPLAAMDWVNLWALAVNEENAASAGAVVTAPTNGAAGADPGGACASPRSVPQRHGGDPPHLPADRRRDLRRALQAQRRLDQRGRGWAARAR